MSEEAIDSFIRKVRVDLLNLGAQAGQTPSFTPGGKRGARTRNPAPRFSPANIRRGKGGRGGARGRGRGRGSQVFGLGEGGQVFSPGASPGPSPQPHRHGG